MTTENKKTTERTTDKFGRRLSWRNAYLLDQLGLPADLIEEIASVAMDCEILCGEPDKGEEVWKTDMRGRAKRVSKFMAELLQSAE